MKRISVLLLMALALGFFSCNKDDNLSTEDQLSKDIEEIQQYLLDHNLEAQSTSSGLHYIIETPGMGNHPTINSTVTVQYEGYLTDGSTFDEGTATFPLKNVIEGWQEGIPLFGKLGRGKLLIPSGMGYGSSGTSGIPANSVLIFDIYLISYSN